MTEPQQTIQEIPPKKPIGMGIKVLIGCGTLMAGFVGLVILLAVIGFVLGSNGNDSDDSDISDASQEQASSPNSANLYQLGQPFKVGYTSYLIKGITWKQRLGNAYFGKTADSRYLLVDVQVKNEDKENRMIPPFKLVDEAGATYDDSADSMYLGEKAVLLDDLNPGVSKSATIVFDVPPEHHYKLVVSGGFWSGEETYVQLN